MTNLKHVYITAHGSYLSGPWLGESAQIGVRLSMVTAATAPVMGAIFTPEEGGEITPDFGTQAGANGTLSKTWTGRIGLPGSPENFDAGRQIDCAEDVWAFLNAIKAYQHNVFRWTHVKVAAVDPLGKTPVVASVYTFTSPLVGGQTSALPPQIAMALSTRANLVGRRGRGRIYIPALYQSAVAADGTVNTSMANALRASFKTLVDALQASPGLTVHQCIVSIMSAESATAVRPVELRTGNRLDTIQSRRRQVAEAYTVTAL